MSYKSVVLNDHPTSFYLLDEVTSGTSASYTGLISQFGTYQQLKDSGLTYSALSGLPIYDYSGNINNGYAANASTKELMPLISGGIRGTQILPYTSIHYVSQGIANENNSDDSFTIEAWCVLPPTESDITIVADTSINAGIFYKNGNIVFKVGSIETQYTASNTESLYIVGIFQNASISLYINGSIVDTASVDGYRFSNLSIDFKTGPADGKFVIDCVGFYKFNLSPNQIKQHYLEGIKEINLSQIVDADGGYLFSMNSSAIKPKFKFSYPASKSWADVFVSGMSLSDDVSYLYLAETTEPTTVTYSFTDFFIVPDYLNISSSQIYWSNDVKGIKVEVKINGEEWEECENGSPLPYYNKNDNQIATVLNLRVTLSSDDTSKYQPILKTLDIFFYSSKNFYSDNSGYYVSSNFDYALPRNNGRILSYNKNNGLKMHNGHGFSLNNIPDVRSVEMIFTPELGENVLVSASSKIYEWSSTGAISKTAISSIYVNGINRTSETNVFDFMSVGLPHHIVITFTSAASNLKFNQNQTDSKSGIGSMYNNLAIYQEALTQARIAQHYLLYIGNIVNLIDDTSMTISESITGNDSTSFTLTSVEPLSLSL